MQAEMIDDDEWFEDDITTLLVLMVMGVSGLRWWSARDVADSFDLTETEARMVLNDLEDYGWTHNRDGEAFRITFRGMQYLRIYMPGQEVPRA